MLNLDLIIHVKETPDFYVATNCETLENMASLTIVVYDVRDGCVESINRCIPVLHQASYDSMLV
jgi:hypothetical protein